MKDNKQEIGKVILVPGGYAITIPQEVVKDIGLKVDDRIVIENLTYSSRHKVTKQIILKRGLVLKHGEN